MYHRSDNFRLRGKKYVSRSPISICAGRGLLLARRDSRPPSAQAKLPGLSTPPFVSKPRRLASVGSRKINLPLQMIHPKLDVANNTINRYGTFVHYWPAIRKLSFVRCWSVTGELREVKVAA